MYGPEVVGSSPTAATKLRGDILGTLQWIVGLVLAVIFLVAMIGAIPRNRVEKLMYPVGIAVAVVVVLAILLS